MRTRLALSGMIVLSLACLLALTPAGTAHALCTSPLVDGNFERQNRNTVSRPWFAEGKAGIDVGKRLSAEGRNNAWARSTSGWNAVRQQVQLSQGVPYILTGVIRSSGNMRDGYFGIRDANQKPLAEIKFGPLANYRRLEVRFTPSYSGWHHVFAGFWATGKDAWIQIDDIQLMAPCNDVILIPADERGRRDSVLARMSAVSRSRGGRIGHDHPISAKPRCLDETSARDLAQLRLRNRTRRLRSAASPTDGRSARSSG